MTFNQAANEDFERAVWRGFWRKILTRLTGENNQLLPFDDIRKQLPILGQHYVGIRQVSLKQIVGSQGRYHDFDRAFLPLHGRTKDRWVNIDLAHYEQVDLPPVELYKIGEIYFVKDGNHRVSVARERGQEFIDAYVTEIEIPFPITADTKPDELILIKARAEFTMQTGLQAAKTEVSLEATYPQVYQAMLEHIAVHRYYLGENRRAEVPYPEAVTSWYENVYLPLVKVLEEKGVLEEFRGLGLADLYVWVMEYLGYLRQLYEIEPDEGEKSARVEAARQLEGVYPYPDVHVVVEMLVHSPWIDDLILQQEFSTFMEQTRLGDLRPGCDLRTTIPGQYARLREHIAVHRWYLGEQRKSEVSYQEAVESWYDIVYMPLVEVTREQKILEHFPGRTETDLYLWIIRRQWRLREEYGEEVPLDEAAHQYLKEITEKPVKKVVKAIKKAAGLE